MYINGMSNNFMIPVANVSKVTPINTDNTVDSSSKVTGATECKTCQNRKYVDGSNEANVSFKTPGKISPEQSYTKVSAHEREHVANAIAKGSKPGAKLISAGVTLKMGVCPECGKAYVEGGVTNTTIQYTENNPYSANRKNYDKDALLGNNIDVSV